MVRKLAVHGVITYDSSPSNAYFAKLILESCTYSLYVLVLNHLALALSASSYKIMFHEQFNFGNLIYAFMNMIGSVRTLNHFTH